MSKCKLYSLAAATFLATMLFQKAPAQAAECKSVVECAQQAVEIARDSEEQVKQLREEVGALRNENAAIRAEIAKRNITWVRNGGSCPDGSHALGTIGVIMYNADYAKNLGQGGALNPDWTWTHPVLCWFP